MHYLRNIFLKYGDRVLFDHVDLAIGLQDKIGLVGRNGAGKSTLLKILARDMLPDSGAVDIARHVNIGFLYQEIDLSVDGTVFSEAALGLSELQSVRQSIDHLNDELATRSDTDSEAYARVTQDLVDAIERYDMLGGDKAEGEVERVLMGLGFSSTALHQSLSTLSGGWRMRVELAKLLLSKPDILLLDEPTNHLDIESIMWLEQYLAIYDGTVIVISHDIQFLDHVTNRTVEIHRAALHDYKAPYSKYIALRADRLEKIEAAYANQQREIQRQERLITRFRAKASKARMAQSLQKQLDRMDRIEIEPSESASIQIRFPDAPRSGREVIRAHHVSKRFGEKRVLENVDFLLERAERVAFVGQNGQGKTTFVRILIDQLTGETGDVTTGHQVQIGYYAQDQSDALDTSKTVLQTLEDVSPPEMRTRLRALLGAFLFSGEDVDKKVSVLSGGERARLALAKLLLHPYNLLVLDEPTNHLDIAAKEVLKSAILNYTGSCIIVSHDRAFLQGLTQKVYEFKDRSMICYLGDVDYFLQKREQSDFRSFEQAKPTENKQQATNEQLVELSQEDREKLKKMKRKLTYIERDIQACETAIQAAEQKMAVAGFYDTAGANAILSKYNTTKTQLVELSAAWDALAEAILALEAG